MTRDLDTIAAEHCQRATQAEWRAVLLPWLEAIMSSQWSGDVERWADALAARLVVAGVEVPR